MEAFPSPAPLGTPDLVLDKRPKLGDFPTPDIEIKYRVVDYDKIKRERLYSGTVGGVLRCYDDCTNELTSSNFGNQPADPIWKFDSEFIERSFGPWKSTGTPFGPDHTYPW